MEKQINEAEAYVYMENLIDDCLFKMEIEKNEFEDDNERMET